MGKRQSITKDTKVTKNTKKKSKSLFFPRFSSFLRDIRDNESEPSTLPASMDFSWRLGVSAPWRLRSASNHRVRGAVMTETILILPLIIVVILLLLYFGWAMVRLQHATVVDRYAAWRQVSQAPGPAAVHNPHTSSILTDTSELNQAFFAGHADQLSLTTQLRFPLGVSQQWINAASGSDPGAGELAQAALFDWPGTRNVTVEESQNPDIPLWQQFAGPLRHHHVRLGNTWKYVNRLAYSADTSTYQPAPGPTLGLSPHVYALFFPTLNQALTSLANQANPIAQSLRDAYRLNPPYQGPALPKSWHSSTH